MATYKDILNSIMNCEGDIVSFVITKDITSDNFLSAIQNSLSDKYKIRYEKDTPIEVIKDIKEKTLLVINYDKKINFRKISSIKNENVIILVIRFTYETSNTEIFGDFTKGGSEYMYSSKLVFLLRNKKLKVLKAREEEKLDNLQLDVLQVVRKQKLDKLNNLNKK